MKRLPTAWLTADRLNVLKQAGIAPEAPDHAEALARAAFYDETLKPAVEGVYASRWVREPRGDEPGLVYCCLSLGETVSERLDALMQEGRIWEASLLDILADHWLLGAAERIFAEIADRCRAEGWGLTTRRMPGDGYPLALAGQIVSETVGHEGPVRYRDPGFLEPVKSLAYFYEVPPTGEVPLHDEECSRCSRLDCPRRQVRAAVEIICRDEIRTVHAPQGGDLLKILQQAGVSPDAPCAGRGVCGRCLVEIQTDNEPRHWVKACTYTVALPLRVWVPAAESWQMAEEPDSGADPVEPLLSWKPAGDYRSHTPIRQTAAAVLHAAAAHGLSPDDGWTLASDQQAVGFSPHRTALTAVALDLGSTTVVMRHLDLEHGRTLGTESFVNPLRAYGADVLSRLTDAEAVPELTRVLRQRLEQALEHSRYNTKPNVIAVGGNNVMGQILLGLPCEGLARAPYSHWIRSVVVSSAGDLWPDREGSVILMPGIGPFTGGDLVAGLIHCGVHRTDMKTLYLDLGTNGEMACGNRNGIFVTAAAAGPAFESLEGSAGVGAVPGAIRRVQLIGPERWHLDTIAMQEPIGFCGSGLISLMSELRRSGYITPEGTLTEEEDGLTFSEGIVVTQNDIRAFQLAKGAIRAGVELLLEAQGWQSGALEQVIVAGGFSRDIRVQDLLVTGLLPAVDPAIVRLVGNACLGGVTDFLLNKEAREGIYNATEVMQPMNLGDTPDFERLFIRHINF